MIRNTTIHGETIESFELSDKQFKDAVKIYELGDTKFASLERANQYVDEWITDESIEENYRNWLHGCVKRGAEIYTYKEGWQPISEIAVFCD